MSFEWPVGFARIPAEPWTRAAVEPRGLKYDAMKAHRWYRCLDRTVREVLEAMRPGEILVDYSSGTGILGERLLKESSTGFGLVNVDILPTFLRVALEKLGGDPRAAFRAIPAPSTPLDEVLGPDLDAPHTSGNTGLLDRGEDAATGALQRTAEGVIPFRGWVRKLTGAERYARQVSAAITAGGVRRGYLRGLATAKACTAAPAKTA